MHELAARADLQTRSLLASLQGQPPLLRRRSSAAITDIDQRLQLWGLAENVYYGISLGAVLLLAAAGLAITFGVMGVINMAHGEMVMVGAYTTFVVQRLIPPPPRRSTSSAVDRGAGGVSGGGRARRTDRTHADPLPLWPAAGDPARHLGSSLILQQAVRSIFGPTNQDVSSPAWMSGAVTAGRADADGEPAVDHPVRGRWCSAR